MDPQELSALYISELFPGSINYRRRMQEAILIRETTDDEDLTFETGSGMELTGISNREDLQTGVEGDYYDF